MPDLYRSVLVYFKFEVVNELKTNSKSNFESTFNVSLSLTTTDLSFPTSHQTWPWTYLFKIKLVTTALLRIIIQETGRALEFCWEFNSKLVCGDNSRGGLEFLNILQPFHFLPNKITRAEFGKSLQSIDNISGPLFKFSRNSCPEVLFWNREKDLRLNLALWRNWNSVLRYLFPIKFGHFNP